MGPEFITVVWRCLKDKAPEGQPVPAQRRRRRRAPAMRRLSLHASALSDDEYDLYTSSIEDLAPCDSNLNDARDDTFYERIAVGVREVRAWLRGRYRDTPVNTIDAVCIRLMAVQYYILFISAVSRSSSFSLRTYRPLTLFRAASSLPF